MKQTAFTRSAAAPTPPSEPGDEGPPGPVLRMTGEEPIAEGEPVARGIAPNVSTCTPTWCGAAPDQWFVPASCVYEWPPPPRDPLSHSSHTVGSVLLHSRHALRGERPSEQALVSGETVGVPDRSLVALETA